MIRCIKIYTGEDGHTHVVPGSVFEDHLTDARSIRFKETPAHASYDWHPAPEIQYVLTLTGRLQFTTRSGETFMIEPGDVLIAMDTSGSGHKWRLVNDEPWKRAYISFNATEEINFIPAR
jgi:hypothetical protein